MKLKTKNLYFALLCSLALVGCDSKTFDRNIEKINNVFNNKDKEKVDFLYENCWNRNFLELVADPQLTHFCKRTQQQAEDYIILELSKWESLVTECEEKAYISFSSRRKLQFRNLKVLQRLHPTTMIEWLSILGRCINKTEEELTIKITNPKSGKSGLKKIKPSELADLAKRAGKLGLEIEEYIDPNVILSLLKEEIDTASILAAPKRRLVKKMYSGESDNPKLQGL